MHGVLLVCCNCSVESGRTDGEATNCNMQTVISSMQVDVRSATPVTAITTASLR